MATSQEKQLKQAQKAQQNLTTKAVSDPTKLVTNPEVQKIQQNDNQFIDPTGTGQVSGDVGYQATTVDQTQTANAPEAQEAETFEATKVQPDVAQHLEGVEAAQGELPPEATVQGQYAKLMEQFKDGQVPPWAAGAIRSANSKMAARGLGASSMAGAAVTQAAMESALPIASQDANVFAQLEFKNLDNRQQTALYKSQQMIASMFSDQAAENVEKQINAASKNQVTQFYASLHSQVEQFNASQVNAIKQFNAGETNASERFNAEMKNLREQFNAQNSLIISQSNARWRQDIATLDAAAQNDANMEAARRANDITQLSLDQIWQRERDIMSFAFQQSENELERQLQIFLADKQIKAYNKQADDQRKADNARGIGQVIGSIVGGLF